MTAPRKNTKIAFGDDFRNIAENSSSGIVPHSALWEESDDYL